MGAFLGHSTGLYPAVESKEDGRHRQHLWRRLDELVCPSKEATTHLHCSYPRTRLNEWKFCEQDSEPRTSTSLQDNRAFDEYICQTARDRAQLGGNFETRPDLLKYQPSTDSCSM